MALSMTVTERVRELGLLDLKPVMVKGTSIVPRDAFIATVSPGLTKPNEPDLVALRVEVTSRGGRRVAWQLLDYADERAGISAMMRTTGYSLSITGQLQACREVGDPGVYTPDECMPAERYIAALPARGVDIRLREE